MKTLVFYIFAAVVAQALLPIGREALALDASAVPQLTLKPKASVAVQRVYLSDIAKCSGDMLKCREITGIDVSASPSPGRSAFVSKSHVEGILEKEWPGVDVLVDGAESTRVEAEGVEIAPEDLRTKFENSLVRTLGDQPKLRLRVVRFQTIGSVSVRPSQSKIEFPEIQTFELGDVHWILRNLIGNRLVQVIASNPNDAGDRTILQANASIAVDMRIPTVKDSVPAGHVLAAGDIESAWVVMRRGYQDLALTDDKIIGRKTRQSLHGGDPVSGRFLESPIAVLRNQPVKMVVKKGDLEISTRAVSQEQGVVGQTIDVVNSSTRKRIRARIIDAQTVEAVAF